MMAVVVQRTTDLVSTSLRKAVGEPVWKSGHQDFFLRGANVIRNAIEGDGVVAGIVKRKRGAWIVVTRLPDRAGIDQVFCLVFQVEPELLFALRRIVIRHQGMAKIVL